jgi:hypothetical protein
MSQARKHLYDLILKWQDAARADKRDQYPYLSVLDDLLFHADLRLRDYVQFQNEGEFPVRLLKWLGNLKNEEHGKALFKLLPWILFIDRLQMRSLRRDAYRRIIVPWISRNALAAEDLLSSEYEAKCRFLLRQYHFLSITESFGFPEFLSVNDLAGLRKPSILGEDKKRIAVMMPDSKKPTKGLIILEDFVGTGKQASEVLAEVRTLAQRKWRILFVPLVILESGFRTLSKKSALRNVSIRPVLIVPNSVCLKERPASEEPEEFKRIRTVVKLTARRVLKQLDLSDDAPVDPFGYRGSGALLVTCHNTPNNSLPLIHHRAPDWEPLFRRLHHSKEGL